MVIKRWGSREMRRDNFILSSPAKYHARVLLPVTFSSSFGLLVSDWCQSMFH